jgi:hypothetical protein
MSRPRAAFKPLLSLLVVGATGYFFFRAFRRNWASVREHEFQIAPLYLVFAVLATLATSLLATYGWQLAINSLSKRGKVTFRQSVAAVNASGLTKYIPGKVWSYALQIYWLNGIGVSKGLIVYVNLLNLVVSMAASVLFGLSCLSFSSTALPRELVLAVLAGLVLLDACCVLFNRAISSAAISLTNRVLHKNFGYFEVETRLLVELHLVHVLAALTSGIGAYLFSSAIGYHLALSHALLLISASLIADVVGFLAIVVPGGLGVREGLMYAMLGGAKTGSLALVLPVASRLMNMAVDLVLGAVALRLLRTLTAHRDSVPVLEGEQNGPP